MRGRVALGVFVVGLVGCAAILGIDDGTPRPDCPQFNLTNDPAHCGACDNACPSGQVCSNSVCKAGCDAPLNQCGGDGGAPVCADFSSDPKHCGNCTTACPVADAGTLTPGTHNPSSDPDGGLIAVPYDGGSGWSPGTAACTSSKCALACPTGFTQCSDGLCYDTANYHDRCGSCTTGCAATDWCAVGHCCPQGQLFCNGKCGDALYDTNNCGGCGVVCGGMTPVCELGKCVASCTPTGGRANFDSPLALPVPAGCAASNACATDVANQAKPTSFIVPNASLTCGPVAPDAGVAPPSCVSHIGIGTYVSPANCQGVWDAYCDGTKVGSISSVGKACTGSAMANNCNVSFSARYCASIKLVAVAGSGTSCCQNGLPVDTRLTAVSAW